MFALQFPTLMYTDIFCVVLSNYSSYMYMYVYVQCLLSLCYCHFYTNRLITAAVIHVYDYSEGMSFLELKLHRTHILCALSTISGLCYTVGVMSMHCHYIIVRFSCVCDHASE